MEIREIDDQPISSSFFGTGKWLTEFITPDNIDVVNLYENITENAKDKQDEIELCWSWVARKVRYVRFVRATMRLCGKSSYQRDLWMEPNLVIKTKIGNCANKSFLLCSLLRNILPPAQVHCVLGNLVEGKRSGGHAWCEIDQGNGRFILEATRSDIEPLIPADQVETQYGGKYEPVHYFNDQEVFIVSGSEIMPFTFDYSKWLSDYLNWGYIKEEVANPRVI